MYRSRKNINLAIASSSSTLRVLAGKVLTDCGYGVCTAGSVEELLDLLENCKPKVLVLQYGLADNTEQLLNQIKAKARTKVLLLTNQAVVPPSERSSATDSGADDVFINAGLTASNLKLMMPQLVKKVHKLLKDEIALGAGTTARAVPGRFICIGSSTGGTGAIEEIVKALPPDFKDVLLIAQHFPTGFSEPFANRLNQLTTLPVVHGSYGMAVKPGMIVIAPSNKHMLVITNAHKPDSYQLQLRNPSHLEFDVPSANLLMISVAEACKSKAVGIILSGMGTDGTKGIGEIVGFGGITIAQDVMTSQASGMPHSAIKSGMVQKVLSIPEIVEFISHRVNPTLA